MKTTIRKLFIDYEKEEKWINDKCEKGLALVSYTFGKYVFEKCNPSEYVYRIELLDNFLESSKSADYLKLLETSNIELVSRHGNWIFLRKNAINGVFDIFSDNHSKINHLKKIATLYAVVSFLQFLVAINLFRQVFKQSESTGFVNIILFSFSVFFFIIGITILFYIKMYRDKINKLEKELSIYE